MLVYNHFHWGNLEGVDHARCCASLLAHALVMNSFNNLSLVVWVSHCTHRMSWHLLNWCGVHLVLGMEHLELCTDVAGKCVCTTKNKNQSSAIHQEPPSHLLSMDQMDCLFSVSPCVSSPNSYWKQHNITFLLPFLKMASYFINPVNISALSTKMQTADYDLIRIWSQSSLKCCLFMVNWKLPHPFISFSKSPFFLYFCSSMRCHKRWLTLKGISILCFIKVYV